MSRAGARALRADDREDQRGTRSHLELVEPPPVGERRTIRITGQPTPPRRRRTPAADRMVATPDRLALYAVLLGLFLVFMAVVTANA
jgi:hypothetical protein